MTGELRLEKPTVPQEVYWGLHFFNETLFEATGEVHEKLDRSLQMVFPGERFEMPPFLQFGSWIGGDRDGNPFVTNDVTRRTLAENRRASLQRYHARLGELVKALSITERAVEVPAAFRTALDKALASVPHGKEIVVRNPEKFLAVPGLHDGSAGRAMRHAESGKHLPLLGGIRHRRRADRGSAGHDQCPDGLAGIAPGKCLCAAGAPRGGGFQVQYGATRSPGEFGSAPRHTFRLVAGLDRRNRRAASCRVEGMESVAPGRARQAARVPITKSRKKPARHWACSGWWAK